MMEQPQDRLIGKTLGQYEIESRLGSGGMATVYLAHQTSIGRQVAIKLLPAHFLHDPSFLKRFQNEVQIIAKLQHPRILPVYDFGMFEGVPYIVMAYLPGGTLTERIQQGPMLLSEVVMIVEAIAQGLDHAHKEGVIHRDFKPSNVLLDKAGNPYLADFGIAKISEGTLAMTGSGIIGTPAYIAPEMASEGKAGPASDIYALGISAYQMLTSRLPFEWETPMRTMMAHISDPPPDVRLLRPDVPAGVSRVLLKALEKEPADRYPTARQFAAALRIASGIPINAEEGYVEAIPEVDPADVQATVRGFELAPATADLRRPTPPDPTLRDPHLRPDSAGKSRSPVFSILAAVIGVMVLGGLIGGGALLLPQLLNSQQNGDDSTQSAGAPTLSAAELAETASRGTDIAATNAFNAAASAQAGETRVAQMGSESATGTAVIEQQTQAALDAAATATAEVEQQTATAEAAVISEGTQAALSTAQFSNYVTALESVQLGAFQENVLILMHTIEELPVDFTQSYEIRHDVNTGLQFEMAPATDYVDFMAQAVFTNPYTTREGLWDMGILFRSTGDDFQYRLRVDAQGSWALESWRGLDIRSLSSTTTGWFDTQGQTNTLTLIVVDERAYIVLNDNFVRKVDIFNLNPFGAIGVGIGFNTQKRLTGYITPIELTIWRLP